MTSDPRGASGPPVVSSVDIDGIVLANSGEAVLDVFFDGRRIWSFWVVRDSQPHGKGHRLVRWPRALVPRLSGHATVALAVHGDSDRLYDARVDFDDSGAAVDLLDKSGQPLGVDNTGQLIPTFENRTAEDTAPLLDSLDTVLGELAAIGIAAFPAYGTLLGAVREQRLIGHDSDVDIAYVSRHQHPVDVIRESFDIQRKLNSAGFRTMRYSGASLKVLVEESDGFVRGLDVFGGFHDGTRLWMLGEIRTPFELDWIFPLGTCVLEGRTLPAPAVPERMLEAMYGPHWKVPDPAYVFSTPNSTVRAFNGLFRRSRALRMHWSRFFHRTAGPLPAIDPSSLAQLLVDDLGVPDHLFDVGAGRAVDSLWFARQGSSVTAYDYINATAGQADAQARKEGVALDVRTLNFQEWRSVFAEGARASRIEGSRAILARHILDAMPRSGRESFARFASMALRGGGRVYADFWAAGGEIAAGDPSRQVSLDEVTALLTAAGGEILSASVLAEDQTGNGRRTGRVVAQWA